METKPEKSIKRSRERWKEWTMTEMEENESNKDWSLKNKKENLKN